MEVGLSTVADDVERWKEWESAELKKSTRLDLWTKREKRTEDVRVSSVVETHPMNAFRDCERDRPCSSERE